MIYRSDKNNKRSERMVRTKRNQLVSVCNLSNRIVGGTVV